MANESSHHMQKLYSKKKLCCKTYYVLSMNLYQINFVLAITKSATGGVLSEAFLIKVAGLRPATLLKKNLWHSCFPMNFAKFLRTPFLQNISERQLLLFYLNYQTYCNYPRGHRT